MVLRLQKALSDFFDMFLILGSFLSLFQVIFFHSKQNKKMREKETFKGMAHKLQTLN